MKIKKKTNIGSTKTSKKPWALITRVAFMDNVEFERRYVISNQNIYLLSIFSFSTISMHNTKILNLNI